MSNADLTGGDRPEDVQAARITPGFLPLFGTTPAAGRPFGPDEGNSKVVLIGHSGGGPYALACARCFPDRVTRVAVASGFAPFHRADAYAGMTPRMAGFVRSASNWHSPDVGLLAADADAAGELAAGLFGLRAGWTRLAPLDPANGLEACLQHASRTGHRVTGLGLRADVRALARTKGVAPDGGVHVAPAGAASLFVRF